MHKNRRIYTGFCAYLWSYLLWPPVTTMFVSEFYGVSPRQTTAAARQTTAAAAAAAAERPCRASRTVHEKLLVKSHSR